MLGGIFFGGLWWTVRKGLTSAQPAFWFAGSMVLRTGIVIAGFYLIADQHLLVSLLGFVVSRVMVTQLTRPAEESRPTQEARRAP